MWERKEKNQSDAWPKEAMPKDPMYRKNQKQCTYKIQRTFFPACESKTVRNTVHARSKLRISGFLHLYNRLHDCLPFEKGLQRILSFAEEPSKPFAIQRLSVICLLVQHNILALAMELLRIQENYFYNNKPIGEFIGWFDRRPRNIIAQLPRCLIYRLCFEFLFWWILFFLLFGVLIL